ncbi:hypothetical protein SAMN05443377_12233 [Propionibacterium cyclohexanicum]|uniref:Polysaccharide deacetylase n=2 Tax=Propionibacterium cyclohexanicum TaxID=64702 RepID=A0A1H9TFM3_9ACTN|nr:hypothetical protein SAMN05443377_12233 [Propionibacterium cyclohexanicum]
MSVLVAGCAQSAPGAAGRAATGASPVTPTPSPTPDPALGIARLKLAQYDYEGARQALKDSNSPEATSLRATIDAQDAAAVEWPDNSTISHLFYHSLIVDPARAFAPTQQQRKGFAEYMVTINEFTKQLQQIYDRGFVLVQPTRYVMPDASGALTYRPIRIPAGKKPLVLSIDDENYYEYMIGAGFASNFTVDDRGQVENTYTDASGKTVLGDYDVPTVVDSFVRAHPDFAYHGDKGILGITGYNGVLGYRSSVKSYGESAHTREEQQKATSVAAALKTDGWTFASHTWGHINATKSSLAQITADTKLWDAEVRPILGDTPQLIFPFGADISGLAQYAPGNAKYDFFRKDGFRYYYPIDASRPYWAQLTRDSYRQARINVDGITMQRELDGKTTVLDGFFDTRSVIDPARPIPTP